MKNRLIKVMLLSFITLSLFTGCGRAVPDNADQISENITASNESTNTASEQVSFSLGEFGSTTIMLTSDCTLKTVEGTSAFDVYDVSDKNVIHADFMTPENYETYLKGISVFSEGYSVKQIGDKSFYLVEPKLNASGKYSCTAYMADKGIDLAIYMEADKKEDFDILIGFEGQAVSSDSSDFIQSVFEKLPDSISDNSILKDAYAVPEGFYVTYECNFFTDYSNGEINVRASYMNADQQLLDFTDGSDEVYLDTYELSLLDVFDVPSGSITVIEGTGNTDLYQYYAVSPTCNLTVNRSYGGNINKDECIAIIRSFITE